MTFKARNSLARLPGATPEVPGATNPHGKNVLGVLGGMGPVASAEFVRTIYSYHQDGPEQRAPFVILYSDPTFPDRTDALLRRSDDLLLKRLVESLTHLCELGASEIVICCVTAHYLLARLPPCLRGKIVSLIDTIFAAVLRTGKRHLLLCTSGTRRSGLFERHPRWGDARRLIIRPQPGDQREIHRLIYRLKENAEIDEMLPRVGRLLAKYEVDSFIAACTELHLVTRRLTVAGRGGEYGCLDPLTIIAESVARRHSHPGD